MPNERIAPRGRSVGRILILAVISVLALNAAPAMARKSGGQGQWLCAGRPATIVGTNASETLLGTAGDDVISANAGNDMIHGMGGNDTICAGRGLDTVYGGDGDDVFSSSPGYDTFVGEAGHDTVTFQDAPAGAVADLRDGKITGDGLDSSDAVTGIEALIGSAFPDRLSGDPSSNDLRGGAGDDYLYGGGGVDTVDGGSDAEENICIVEDDDVVIHCAAS